MSCWTRIHFSVSTEIGISVNECMYKCAMYNILINDLAHQNVTVFRERKGVRNILM